MARALKQKEDAGLIIKCMDGRMENIRAVAKIVGELRSEGKSAVVLSDAGANVTAFEKQIYWALKTYNINTVYLLVHNECGAVGYACKHHDAPADDNARLIISQFGQLTEHGPEVVSKEQPEFKRRLLNQILTAQSSKDGKQYNVIVEEVKVSPHDPSRPIKEVALVRADDAAIYEVLANAKHIPGMYVIQAPNPWEMTASLELAITALKVSVVNVVALKAAQKKKAEQELERVRATLNLPSESVRWIKRDADVAR